MAGWLLTTLLVPVLVDAIDHQGIVRARAVARGFLGVIMAAFCVGGLLILAAGPLIVRALTIGIHDDAARADARRHRDRSRRETP